MPDAGFDVLTTDTVGFSGCVVVHAPGAHVGGFDGGVPPVGTTLNVVCGVTQVKMDRVIVGVWPFMLAQLVVMALLIVFPDLVLVPMRFLTG